MVFQAADLLQNRMDISYFALLLFNKKVVEVNLLDNLDSNESMLKIMDMQIRMDVKQVGSTYEII